MFDFFVTVLFPYFEITKEGKLTSFWKPLSNNGLKKIKDEVDIEMYHYLNLETWGEAGRNKNGEGSEVPTNMGKGQINCPDSVASD